MSRSSKRKTRRLMEEVVEFDLAPDAKKHELNSFVLYNSTGYVGRITAKILRGHGFNVRLTKGKDEILDQVINSSNGDLNLPHYSIDVRRFLLPIAQGRNVRYS